MVVPGAAPRSPKSRRTATPNSFCPCFSQSVTVSGHLYSLVKKWRPSVTVHGVQNMRTVQVAICIHYHQRCGREGHWRGRARGRGGSGSGSAPTMDTVTGSRTPHANTNWTTHTLLWGRNTQSTVNAACCPFICYLLGATGQQRGG